MSKNDAFGLFVVVLVIGIAFFTFAIYADLGIWR